MNTGDPIAYFLTWVTYGTWLPGDVRGWVEYKRGWQFPRPTLEADCESRLTKDAVRLTLDERRVVEWQIGETCRHRGWHLHAVNCRTNHVHVVVTAPETRPKKIRVDLKSYATRRLKSLDRKRETRSVSEGQSEHRNGARKETRSVSEGQHWWAERGSIRWVFSQDDLESVIHYVMDGQEW